MSNNDNSTGRNAVFVGSYPGSGGGGNNAVNEDKINPPHYKAHLSGVECIQITEWMNFNLGNAVKYIWRCQEKNNTIIDLKKAAWYLNREIERLEKQHEQEQKSSS